MAFFKFRKDSDERPAPTKVPESVEVMRQRARHRLIGSALLVLLGVVGFPLLFDNQPRPIAVDIPIEIPDRNQVKPLVSVASAASAPASEMVAASESEIEFIEPPTKPKASAPQPVPAPAKLAAAPAAKVAASAPSTPKAAAPVKASTTPTAPAKVAAASSAPAAPVKTATAPPVAKPDESARRNVDDGAKAQALLEGKEPVKEVQKPAAEAQKPAAAGRFVVQVGAFSDTAKAHEVRLKLERSGLKTYAQILPAKDGTEGKRIRVRIGPFASKAEADATVQKIKKLDLPAGIFEL
ncbi:MAG: SPOR domain-containing protein [Rhodoferax sp.]|nr:SPOR domain-containing protein [Rhodoferax sp.]